MLEVKDLSKLFFVCKNIFYYYLFLYFFRFLKRIGFSDLQNKTFLYVFLPKLTFFLFRSFYFKLLSQNINTKLAIT